jgi:vacuolar protein sorting-associated protein 13D
MDFLQVIVSDPFEVSFHVDGFPSGATVSVNPNSSSAFISRVRMIDIQKRSLVLGAKFLKEEGGVVVLMISCPCWVVNKSGLPLLTKQEGCHTEAAGQFQEHEVGRMVSPLMMSFTSESEGTDALTFRVGSGLHKDSKSFWCRSIACQVGIRVRKLTVSHANNRPESVYMVGVEMKNGTGRYRDTKLVIVSPRFVVDNRSASKIQIAQRCYATSFYDAKAEATHLSLPSGCNLPFHWPRLDKEQLLCVRLKDVEGSGWSGGFPIDNVDSFHINIRDKEGKCYFLRVEIVLQGPSYFVIFSDTSQLPPPFRIDNFSLVPLIFHQVGS